MPRSQLCIIRS